MAQQFLKLCNVLYVDHLAVTTPVFEQTLSEYLCLTGSRLLRGPAVNQEQQVEYAFVQLQGGITVEILGVKESSPISGHVAKGGGPNHFCYAVANIDASISNALKAGARVILSPISDVAFDGRRVAFLFYEPLGVLEFVEAFPSIGKVDALSASGGKSIPSIDVASHVQMPLDIAAEKIDGQLREIFMLVFPKLDMSAVQAAVYNVTEGWDSLNQLRLIMAVEDKFNISVSPEEMAFLSTFELICKMIANKL